MALTLTIENETSLPDGGPLSVSVSGKRGLDMGRDTHLDWTLPDPTRYISGKHCEIRYKDGGYWLYDVSTNGTFLYGSEGRLKGPHRLRNGDRLIIGHYIIAVTVTGEEAATVPAREARAASYDDLWNPIEEAAPAVDRSQVQSPREAPRPVGPDFLDWAADCPPSVSRGDAAHRLAFRHRPAAGACVVRSGAGGRCAVARRARTRRRSRLGPRRTHADAAGGAATKAGWRTCSCNTSPSVTNAAENRTR